MICRWGQEHPELNIASTFNGLLYHCIVVLSVSVPGRRIDNGGVDARALYLFGMQFSYWRRADGSEALASRSVALLSFLHPAVNFAWLSTPPFVALLFDIRKTYSQAQSRFSHHLSASYHLLLHNFENPKGHSAGREAASVTGDRSNDTRVRSLRDQNGYWVHVMGHRIS